MEFNEKEFTKLLQEFKNNNSFQPDKIVEYTKNLSEADTKLAIDMIITEIAESIPKDSIKDVINKEE